LKKLEKSRQKAQIEEPKLETKKQKDKKSKKKKPEPEPEPEGARSLAPMTKEEWDKRQSVIRRVFDEDTGKSLQFDDYLFVNI
jgi:hypothetical protein